MTVATFTHLPLQVGGVVLASAGRAALWVIARYMRAPLTNTAIFALVATSAMAGSNALFMQRHAHPAPLFATVEPQQLAEVEPVVPAVRPKKLAVKSAEPAVEVKQPAVPVLGDGGPIGNSDVFEVQRKLAMLKLFSGTIDGYYGPQTARAIRKFEEMRGLKPTGELSRDIIEMIRTAPLSMGAPETKAEPQAEAEPAAVLPLEQATPEPAREAETVPEAQVKPQALAALPEPAPLTMEITTGSVTQPDKEAEAATLLGRKMPDSPDEALDMAAETAGDAIDTIISGVQSVAMKPKSAAVAQPFAESSARLTTKEDEAATQVAMLPAAPKVGVPLAIDDAPAPPGEPIAVLDTDATPEEIMAPFSVTDPVIVAKVQRGLASLGFLHGPADGVAGEATAKAIRNFEVYFNYKVTGRISPELLDLLADNGASI